MGMGAGRQQGADGAPLAAWQRKLVDVALVLQPLSGADGPDDLDGLAGAPHGPIERHAVPAFHDLGAAGSDAEQEPSA